MIERIGRIKYSLPMINSYVIEVPEYKINSLRGAKGILSVHYNAQITAQSMLLRSNMKNGVSGGNYMPEERALLGKDDMLCNHVVSSEITAASRSQCSARDAIHASSLQYRGYTGKGVAVAILDTGVSSVDDLTLPFNRITAFMDFVNGKNLAYDDNGHGTHVAGIVSGNGVRSRGKYMGIAPESTIVAIKTLNEKGKGNTADVLAGIQWMIDNKKKYGIRIGNLSIGTSDVGMKDPLVRAVEAAWKEGIVMVIAAGNNGPGYGSVTSPGISRKVITVGASDDSKKATIWGGVRENYSGRGPTMQCVIKPDVLAPGADIISCMTTTPTTERKNKSAVSEYYMKMSGTSMATPIVSGAIALLLQKNPRLKPDDVKLMLKNGTVDLNYPKNRQGWGLIDIEKLLSGEVLNAKQ